MIKHYCYVVDHYSLALVMMMILIVEYHYVFLLSSDVRPLVTISDAQECSRVIVNLHQ